jgi:hypothetical protein
VFRFFEEQKLTPEKVRALSQHQVGALAAGFDALNADPKVIARDLSVSVDRIGGFLALRTPKAPKFSEELRRRGVWTDYRGDVLRLGPAPYLADEQLTVAMTALRDVLGSIR